MSSFTSGKEKFGTGTANNIQDMAVNSDAFMSTPGILHVIITTDYDYE